MTVRSRAVTDGVPEGVDPTRALVFPQDTSPSLTTVDGGFPVLSVAEALVEKVQAADCSSSDEGRLLWRSGSTLHLGDSCRRGVGIEFEILKLFNSLRHSYHTAHG